MNILDQSVFNEAVRLAQNGQTTAAYDSLKHLSELYPNDSNVLLWLAFSAPDSYISQQAINRLELIDPQNASLPAARQWLAQLENTLPLAAAAAKNPQPQPSLEVNYNSAQTLQAVPAAPERQSFSAMPEVPVSGPAIVRIPPPIVSGQPPVLPRPPLSVDSLGYDFSARTGKAGFLTNRLLLIGGAVIGAILVVGFLVFLIGSLTQPKPPRLKPDVARQLYNSSFDNEFKNALLNELDSDNAKIITSDLYATPQNVNDTRKFYDTNLRKENWAFVVADTNSLASEPELKNLNSLILIYSKAENKSMMMVIIMGPLTQSTLEDWSKDPANKDLAKTLRPGESIIVLTEIAHS